MAASQEKIRKIVPGFKWVLGFSGGSFQTGNPEEAKGDQRMIGETSSYLKFENWINEISYAFIYMNVCVYVYVCVCVCM